MKRCAGGPNGIALARADERSFRAGRTPIRYRHSTLKRLTIDHTVPTIRSPVSHNSGRTLTLTGKLIQPSRRRV